jgi:hypothetical protein
MVTKIISGGQTGIDQMSLEVAKMMGIETGGSVPRGFKTERGPDSSLTRFNLVETRSEGYSMRTVNNVKDSDGTLIFGDARSPENYEALSNAITQKKPHLINPSIEQLTRWLLENNIQVLHVAGSRGSRLTVNQCREYQMVLVEALKNVNSIIPTKIDKNPAN